MVHVCRAIPSDVLADAIYSDNLLARFASCLKGRISSGML